MGPKIGRRQLLAGAAATGLITNTTPLLADRRLAYRGPNVIIVRFGGGVRRRETINPDHTYAPYTLFDFARRGTLFTNMTISSQDGVVTSHGQGTLYILTGKYEKYENKSNKLLAEQFEASVPTLFEYLRKSYAIAPHEALLVNGEDRKGEEFYTFGNHRMFGVHYRSEVLSLYRFKAYLLRRRIKKHKGPEDELMRMQKELKAMEQLDLRKVDAGGQSPQIEAFWEKWRRHYGESGLKNPRGDRLLTELTVRALKELRPKLLMVNYQDPDYVHWGNASHYTRGISIIDQGVKRLVQAVDNDPEYRNNTIFVIVPDCGRDTNSLMSLPYQHHFNSKSSHEIWALMAGPGIPQNTVVDKPVDQSSIARTVGQFMNFKARYAEGPVLEEAFA